MMIHLSSAILSLIVPLGCTAQQPGYFGADDKSSACSNGSQFCLDRADLIDSGFTVPQSHLADETQIFEGFFRPETVSAMNALLAKISSIGFDPDRYLYQVSTNSKSIHISASPRKMVAAGKDVRSGPEEKGYIDFIPSFHAEFDVDNGTLIWFDFQR